MILTDELLLYYQRCHRRTFLEVYGDQLHKTISSEFYLRLQRQRLTYQQSIQEQQIITTSTPQYPRYKKGDWETGYNLTLELMYQGVDTISQGVLLSDSFAEHNITLIGTPDILIKQPGESIFGNWIYSPVNIYSSKKPKLEYKIISAYHIQLLSNMQEYWAENAWIIVRNERTYQVDLWRVLPEMQSILNQCLEMLINQTEPDLFISKQLCSLCPWLNSCYKVAKEQKHLSLLPGVTPIRQKHLQKLNITTLESLASLNPLYLQPELEAKIAEQLIRQAASVLYNKVIINPGLSNNNLPDSPIELYFDIEAQPDLNLDYLLGVLVVDHINNTQVFYPCLAENKEQEELAWIQFLELVEKYPNAPIYHFSPYEYDTVKRLAKLYNTEGERGRIILKRLIDLYEIITKTVTLPIEGYSLKAIASWLGFKWRDEKANGSLCICWYDDWLRTGDRSFLESILRYNEDDCIATFQVKKQLSVIKS